MADDDAVSAQPPQCLDKSLSHQNADNRIVKDLDKKSGKTIGSGQNFGHWLVDNPRFNWVIALIVVLNCVHMGVEADFPGLPVLWWMEVFFTMAFSAEMVLKVLARRRRYFKDRWNCVDLFLVVLAVSDLMIELCTDADSQLSAFSVLRVLRLVRLVRIVRLVKTFHKLVLVVQGVVDAMHTTFWVACMLLLAIYIGAIFCVMFLGHDKGSKYPGFSVDPDEIAQSELFQNFNPFMSFGSLRKAMLTLFNMAILAEWAEVVQPVMSQEPVLVVFFLGYVVFVTFGLMNVMIGMIVDSVMTNAKDLAVLEQESEKQRKKKILSKISAMAAHIDKDGNKFVDIHELEEVMSENDTSGFKELMLNVELPIGFSPKEMMRMLDSDGDGRLQREEFVEAFYRLIDSNDFQRICMMQTGMNEIKSLMKWESKQSQHHREKLEKRLQHLEHHSRDLASHIHASTDRTAAGEGGLLASSGRLQSSELASLCSTSSIPVKGIVRPTAKKAASTSSMDTNSTNGGKGADVRSRDSTNGGGRGGRDQGETFCSVADLASELVDFISGEMAHSETSLPHLDKSLPQRDSCCSLELIPQRVYHFDESVRQLGLEVAYADSFPSVISVAPGGEACRQGVCPGDVLVTINAEDTESRPRDEILQQLRARPLSLEVRRGHFSGDLPP